MRCICYPPVFAAPRCRLDRVSTCSTGGLGGRAPAVGARAQRPYRPLGIAVQPTEFSNAACSTPQFRNRSRFCCRRGAGDGRSFAGCDGRVGARGGGPGAAGRSGRLSRRLDDGVLRPRRLRAHDRDGPCHQPHPHRQRHRLRLRAQPRADGRGCRGHGRADERPHRARAGHGHAPHERIVVRHPLRPPGAEDAGDGAVIAGALGRTQGPGVQL
jgi:hypothetical protein